MSKANIIGTIGVALIAMVWLAAVAYRMLSPTTAWLMLGACLIAFALGLWASVVGRRWWLLESGFAILTAVFVILGLVGS